MVPGRRFMVIRSDFGSELVRQGHGNDMIVAQPCPRRAGARLGGSHGHSQLHPHRSPMRPLDHGRVRGPGLLVPRLQRQSQRLPPSCAGRFVHLPPGGVQRAALLRPPLFHPSSASCGILCLLARHGAGSPRGLRPLCPARGPHRAAGLHTARLRSLLAPEDDLDSAVILTDPPTGLPLSVVHMVPLEAEDPVPFPVYVAPVPCPAWLDDGDAREDAARAVASTAAGPSIAAGAPPPPLGNGILADLLLAPDAYTTAIRVNPNAVRRDDSAPR
jgi:hypothetical protein